MTARHKFFISYHHENDQRYKDALVAMLQRVYGLHGLDYSVGNHNINSMGWTLERIMQKIRDDYIRDATVTVVLYGAETYKRKFVDWEIRASLRNTQHNPRCGLLGILLPSHQDHARDTYNSSTIHPVFHDNIKTDFAGLYDWRDDGEAVSGWIDDAFQRRKTKSVILDSPTYAKNH